VKPTFQTALLRRRHWLAAATLLVVATAALVLRAAHAPDTPAAAVTPYPHDLAQVSFTVAGDVIPHEAVRNAAAAAGEGTSGWTALFSGVADLFHAADFGFVNLETPVAPQHDHGTRAFLFDAPLALPEALKASGVKIVSFANNHAMDQGWAGFAETRQHLRELGLIFAGTSDGASDALQPVFTEAHGIKIGWLGITRWLNGNRNPDDPAAPHVNLYAYPGEVGAATGPTAEQILAAIKAARAQCDLLVVSMHWGVEYATTPRAEDVALAHAMLDAGASVIVGHHPHVLQSVETYRTQDGRNTVIFYSLGNFLSNQSRGYVDGLMPDATGDPRDALIAQFSAVRRDYGPAGIKVELGHVGILPVWGENNRNLIAAGRAKTPVIRPVLIDREIPRLQKELDALEADGSDPAVFPAEKKKKYVELTTQLKLLTDRRALILNRTGDEYLAAPPKLPVKP